jgi:hypothetical protein
MLILDHLAIIHWAFFSLSIFSSTFFGILAIQARGSGNLLPAINLFISLMMMTNYLSLAVQRIELDDGGGDDITNHFCRNGSELASHVLSDTTAHSSRSKLVIAVYTVYLESPYCRNCMHCPSLCFGLHAVSIFGFGSRLVRCIG